MKITKTKEVVTEDIEIKAGIYYFEDDDLVVYKFVLEETEDDYTNYMLEIVQNFSNIYSLTIKKDGAWDEEGLPWRAKQFFLGGTKKIEKEQYYKERTELLERLQ